MLCRQLHLLCFDVFHCHTAPSAAVHTVDWQRWIFCALVPGNIDTFISGLQEIKGQFSHNKKSIKGI